MNDSPYIFDATQGSFAQLVLENSFRQPVLVDFWAAWCQPCQILAPLLKRLAEEYQGAFLLAKVNADYEQALAAQFRVRGLPTVKVFRDGQAVEELVGLQPESVYRAVIQRYQVKASPSLQEQAQTAWQQGKREKALGLLREAIALEPENSDLKIALAEKLLAIQRVEEASEVLNSLPPEVCMQDPASGLLARLEFFQIAKDVPPTSALQATISANPDHCTARHQLGARKAVEGDFEAALEQFIEILRRDPKFSDEAGRKSLLAVFNILGRDHPLAATYRRKMSVLMH
jgi:putative thioredoxin